MYQRPAKFGDHRQYYSRNLIVSRQLTMGLKACLILEIEPSHFKSSACFIWWSLSSLIVNTAYLIVHVNSKDHVIK